MREFDNLANIEELLPLALAQTEPSSDFVNRLRIRLQQAAAVTKPAAVPARRLRWAWGLAFIFLVLLGSMLALGPRKVLSQLERWFGFIPDYGFISSSEPLALGQAIYQDTHAGRVTLASGFADGRGTILHLEFDREANAPGRVWIEDNEGRQLKLQSWAFMPDQPGSQSLELHFGPMPKARTTWVLRSDDGWYLPLDWQPATSSRILQPNLLNSPSPLPNPSLNIERAIPCLKRKEVSICLAAVSVADGQIALLLEESVTDQGMVHAFNFDQFINPDDPEQGIQLQNAAGASITLTASGPSFKDGYISYTLSGELREEFSTEGQLKLLLPALQFRLPLETQLHLDIPTDLQDGESFSMDQNLDLGLGMLNFGQATLTGTRLFIYSEEYQAKNGLEMLALELSKPERVDDLYGSSSEATAQGRRARLMLELEQPDGRLDGEVDLPIIGAYFLWTDLPELSFEIQALPAGEPASLPLPAPTAILPAHAAPATKLPLLWHNQPEASPELLYRAQKATVTTLYQTSAVDQYSFHPWVEIPGRVAALSLVPNMDALAFILGQDNQNPDWLFRQTSLDALYLAPFGGEAKLLTELPPHSVEAAWSPDGQTLALLQRLERPGHKYSSSIHLIRMQDGAHIHLPIGDFWAQWLSWSNAGDKLAILNFIEDNAGSQTQIMVFDLNDPRAAPRVYTPEAHSSLEFSGPLMWMGDDQAILSACGEASLCLTDLNESLNQAIVEDFNLGLVRDGLAAQRWLARFAHSTGPDRNSLMVYDLLEKNDRSLFSIATGETTKSQWGIMDLAASRWGGKLAVYTSARGLEIYDLVSGKFWTTDLPDNPEAQWMRGNLVWVK
jgi:hypothetical protein